MSSSGAVFAVVIITRYLGLEIKVFDDAIGGFAPVRGPQGAEGFDLALASAMTMLTYCVLRWHTVGFFLNMVVL